MYFNAHLTMYSQIKTKIMIYCIVFFFLYLLILIQYTILYTLFIIIIIIINDHFVIIKME